LLVIFLSSSDRSDPLSSLARRRATARVVTPRRYQQHAGNRVSSF
jgi:hypothetical protein